MRKPARKLAAQVKALEALAGLTELDEHEARATNGGRAVAGGTPGVKPPKLRRGTGAVAARGTGAIRFVAGTGALVVRGSGAVAARNPGF